MEKVLELVKALEVEGLEGPERVRMLVELEKVEREVKRVKERVMGMDRGW